MRRFVGLFPREERPRVEDACRRVSGKVSAWTVAILQVVFTELVPEASRGE